MAKRSKLQIAKSRTDKLCTPVAKTLHPNCEVCGQPTTVGHHWIEKSRSNNLRYNPDNLIGLCQSCHYKIHNRNGTMIMTSHDIVDDIIKVRGKDWKERMDIEGRKIIKADLNWVEKAEQELKSICG